MFKNCDLISSSLPSMGYGAKTVETSTGSLTVSVKEMPSGTHRSFIRDIQSEAKKSDDLIVLSRKTMTKLLHYMALSTRYETFIRSASE